MTRSVFRRFPRATIMRRRRVCRRAGGSNSLDVQSRLFAQSVGFLTVSSNRRAVTGDKRHFVPLLSPSQSGEIAYGALSPHSTWLFPQPLQCRLRLEVFVSRGLAVVLDCLGEVLIETDAVLIAPA